jgi:glycosyltransferase involved in cell wall biosynthesis
MDFVKGKIGVAISTYASDFTYPTRLKVSDRCINSVLESLGENSLKLIVNDASTNETHLKNLSRYRNAFEVIDNPRNVGNMSGKNVCIKRMYDSGCEFMFLLDDDIEVLPGWAENYVNAIEKTGIQHFQFCINGLDGAKSAFDAREEEMNGVRVYSRAGATGALITLTRECDEKVGYLKILPGRYGHSHCHYSKRMFKAGMCGPYPNIQKATRDNRWGAMDVVGTEDFVSYRGWKGDAPEAGGPYWGQADDYSEEFKSGAVGRNHNLSQADERIYIPFETADTVTDWETPPPPYD